MNQRRFRQHSGARKLLLGSCALLVAAVCAPGLENTLVVGPWLHGGWARMDGDFLGCIAFDAKTSLHFQREFQFPFFEYHLKGEGVWDATEANAFLTGSNEWRAYDSWPPAGVTSTSLYLGPGGTLGFEPPTRTGTAPRSRAPIRT